MQADEQTITTRTTTSPVPPRYWWLKRMSLAGVLLLVAVGVLRWRVDIIASQRLNAGIAAIQAAGEPIRPRDFNVDPVPDKDNAAILLAEAVEKLVELNPDGPTWEKRVTEDFAAKLAGRPAPSRPLTISDFLFDPSLLDLNAEAIDLLLKDNKESLRLVREARFKPAADWGLRFDDSLIDAEFPDLRRHIDLTQLVCVAALAAHRRGDDLAAVAYLQDVLAYAEHVNAMPHLLGGLLGIAESTIATQTLEDILPTLGSDETRAEVDGAPTRSRVELENLLQVFQADEGLREGVVAGFQFERAICLDGALVPTESSFYSPVFDDAGWMRQALIRVVAFLYRPILRLDGVHLLDSLTAQVSTCRATLLGGRAEPGPDFSDFRFDRILDRQTAYLSAFLLPNFVGTIENAARDLSKRHLAATAIAIRLYELDHGRRPEGLDELVPNYLPTVPIDLFSETGEAVHYVPDGPQARLELKSLTPSTESNGAESRSRRSNRDRDVVFRLTARLDTKASSTQASSEECVDQRDDVEHEAGQPDGDEADDQHP